MRNDPISCSSPLRLALAVLARGVVAARVLLLTLTLCCSACSQEPATPPNVLIVALDTLRADHLGCYGYKRPTSPKLDAFARGSFLFEHAQSSCPWTAPALISLMTSLYPEVHQVRDSPNPGRMSDNVTTLAEILQRHGYATAAFTEGGYAKGDFGLDQGFDLYPKSPEDASDDHSIQGQASRIRNNVDRTIAWLREREHSPFFLFFHTYEPHSPYRAPEEYVHPFVPGYDEGAEHEAAREVIESWNDDRLLTGEGALTLALHRLRCHALEDLPRIESPESWSERAAEHGLASKDYASIEPIVARAKDLYDAAIRHTDDQVERIFAALRELDLFENTVIVVVSDHGEGLGEHGQMEHGEVLHEEILQIALILRVPESIAGGLPRGRRIKPVVRSIDVLPTLLELTGTDERNLVIQGQSLVPFLRGGGEEHPAFSHGRTIERSLDTLETVRSGTWRLIADTASGGTELYDLRSDPHEQIDVAAHHPDVVARLLELLERQRDQDALLQRVLASDVAAISLDDETKAELRRLGYIGDDSTD